MSSFPSEIRQEAAMDEMPTGFVGLQSDHGIGSIWDPLKQKKKKKSYKTNNF